MRVGFKPLVVLAYERPERRGVVSARWTDPNRVGRDRRRKHSLDVTVRGEDGVLDPAKVRIAEARVRDLYTKLVAGKDPDAPDDAGDSWTGEDGATLTIERGVELAFRLDGSGMYAVESRQRRDTRKAARTAVALLGRATRWTELTPSRVAGVWRALAKRHVADGSGGPRHAEVVISALYAVAQWLRDNEVLPGGAARPRKEWRKLLKREWEDITGQPVRPARPRHTPEEMQAIFAALPEADPRIRLAVELGAELRLGQVLRAVRRDLLLDRTPECPHGRIDIRGRGRKQGELVFLTPEQRAAVDAACAQDGYLGAHEAAYQSGAIRDYPLFPGGKLVRGVARVRTPPVLLDRRTALDLFHALEQTARVEPVSGRGWYGLRRQAADLAPSYTSDDRVLDRVGGHGRETREAIYQDRRSARLALAASTVRRQLRGGAKPPVASLVTSADESSSDAVASMPEPVPPASNDTEPSP